MEVTQVNVPDIPQTFRLESENSVPLKSAEKYERQYEQFMAWKDAKKVETQNFSEDVLLEYFSQLADKYKPTSLSVTYCMLKTTIQQNHNVDINYSKLNDFLKTSSIGYVPQKASLFEPEDIRKFLCEAPDDEFLVIKVVLIFGLHGVTRSNDLTKVGSEHVKEQGNVIIVKVPETIANVVRSFTLKDEHASYVRKYMQLRPRCAPSNRFFLNYIKGKCTKNAIGRNQFLAAPKIIARFLKLADEDKYTGYSYRRTYATLLADADANILALRPKYGSIIKNSVANKRRTVTMTTTVRPSQSTTVNIDENCTLITGNVGPLATHSIAVDPLATTSISAGVVALASTSFGANVPLTHMTIDLKRHSDAYQSYGKMLRDLPECISPEVIVEEKYKVPESSVEKVTTNIVKVSGVTFRTNIPLKEVCHTENTLEITPIDDSMFDEELCNVSYLNETCRACLKDLRSSMDKISFFNDFGEISAEIASILTALQSMNVEVRRDDTVPLQVCMECYNIFSKMTLFREICKRSNRALDNICAFTTEQLRKRRTGDNSDILFGTWGENTEIKVEPVEIEEASLPFEVQIFGEADKIQNQFKNDDSYDERQNFREESPAFEDESCADEEDPNLGEIDHHEESSDNSFSCMICFKSFSTWTKYRKHQQCHKSYCTIGFYRCPFCEQRFDSLKQLGLHKKKDHLNKMFKCPHCAKEYRRSDSFRRHISTHNPVKEHKCTFCEKEFVFKHHLVNHLRSHTKENPFLCNFCAKTFRWEQSLKDHLSSHDPKLYPRRKQYTKPPQETRQCTQCSYTSKYKEHMKKHMLSYHDPANPRRDFEFSCHICDKQFKIRISLEKHLETHKEIRDHHCTQCKASFKEACTLKLHIEGVHLKLKPHKCDQCNAAYIVSSDLKRHKMQKHSTERPFQCCYCKKAFATKIGLKAHIKLHDRSNKDLIFI